MSEPPPHSAPPRSDSRRAAKVVVVVISSVVILGALGVFLIVHYVSASGITRPLDNKFGDQHLKTAVALIELHKVRYGRYPNDLRELRFTGEWDQIALKSVRYYAAPDGSAYHVEVERGWMGRPDFELPPDFWSGTGYSPTLSPPPQ